MDFQSEEEPTISPPIQSILESDELADDSEVDTEIEAPTSMDGETLTRTDNGGIMLLGGGGTMGKSTCVTFAAYQSARWKCHRYEVDGSHSYGHYFYTSEIAYHTIDGVDSYCIEPNTTSLGGQYYTSYTAEEASSSSYWKLELDDLQRSHIQKILAFGYPQVDVSLPGLPCVVLRHFSGRLQRLCCAVSGLLCCGGIPVWVGAFRRLWRRSVRLW